MPFVHNVMTRILENSKESYELTYPICLLPTNASLAAIDATSTFLTFIYFRMTPLAFLHSYSIVRYLLISVYTWLTSVDKDIKKIHEPSSALL
jgi:hypothetical protein